MNTKTKSDKGDSKNAKPGSAEIAIVGSFPPPYGGISVPAERMTRLLEEWGVGYRVYNGVGDFSDWPRVVNIRRRAIRFSLASLLWGRHKVYYITATKTRPRFWGGLMGLTGRRVILNVAGASMERALQSPSRRERWMIRFAVRHAWGIIGVNPVITRLAAEVRGSDERVWMIPGYLHPDPNEQTVLDESGERFLAAHEPNILAMGRFYELGGKEVYGVPLLIELLARLRQRHPKAGVFFALTRPEDLEGPKWPPLRDRIEELGLREHFHIHHATSPLVGLMRRCNLLVRPSSTDGDAVSIREALFLGLPVVTSDCVPRPAPVILHRTGDLDDLQEKVVQALADLPALRENLRCEVLPDNWPATRAVLAEALGRAT